MARPKAFTGYYVCIPQFGSTGHLRPLQLKKGAHWRRKWISIVFSCQNHLAHSPHPAGQYRPVQGNRSIRYLTFSYFWGQHSPSELVRGSTLLRERVFPKTHSPTSLPNIKFIFPKQIFIILCGLSLPRRPKTRVLALICVMSKLQCAVCQQLELPDARSWAAPTRQLGLPFPASIMVKITPTGPLSSSQAGQDAIQGQHSSLLTQWPLKSKTGALE